jgi:hypothetical protein
MHVGEALFCKGCIIDFEDVGFQQVPIRNEEVSHSFNGLAYLRAAVLKDSFDLLLVTGDRVNSTESFIVVDEVADARVFALEEFGSTSSAK